MSTDNANQNTPQRPIVLEPYVRAKAGDVLLADSWNQVQVEMRKELRDLISQHDHTSGQEGPILDGSAIASSADLRVKTLQVAGESELGGKLRVSGPIEVSGTSMLGGAVRTQSTLDVAGRLSVGSDLEVTGASTLGGSLSAEGDVEIKGELTLRGRLNPTYSERGDFTDIPLNLGQNTVDLNTVQAIQLTLTWNTIRAYAPAFIELQLPYFEYDIISSFKYNTIVTGSTTADVEDLQKKKTTQQTQLNSLDEQLKTVQASLDKITSDRSAAVKAEQSANDLVAQLEAKGPTIDANLAKANEAVQVAMMGPGLNSTDPVFAKIRAQSQATLTTAKQTQATAQKASQDLMTQLDAARKKVIDAINQRSSLDKQQSTVTTQLNNLKSDRNDVKSKISTIDTQIRNVSKQVVEQITDVQIEPEVTRCAFMSWNATPIGSGIFNENTTLAIYTEGGPGWPWLGQDSKWTSMVSQFKKWNAHRFNILMSRQVPVFKIVRSPKSLVLTLPIHDSTVVLRYRSNCDISYQATLVSYQSTAGALDQILKLDAATALLYRSDWTLAKTRWI